MQNSLTESMRYFAHGCASMLMQVYEKNVNVKPDNVALLLAVGAEKMAESGPQPTKKYGSIVGKL